MRRSYLIILALFASLFLMYCSAAKKSASAPLVTTFYNPDINMLVQTNCSPCHIPSKGGNKEPFDTFEGTRDHIDEILTRIQLNPGDRGFMPMKHAKLSDSAINVFKRWKAEGLLKSK